MNSLRARLLIAASIVLVVFLSFTGFILDRAYEQSARVSTIARLETNVHDLLRIADPSSSSALTIPGGETDRRLMQPKSGLYAEVKSDDGRLVWQSPSMLGMSIPFKAEVIPGNTEFQELETKDGRRLFAISMGVIWEDNRGVERSYIFSVAENTSLYQRQLVAFRKALWLWLGGLVFILLVVQWTILNWGLSPLRRVTKELRKIEEGEQSVIEGQYPLEVAGLTSGLNTLIRHERSRQERYRNAMADLAHSVKTPLAVLRSIVDSSDFQSETKETLQEQVERLDEITRYQLSRAATSGQTTFIKPTAIKPIINKVINALKKVYQEKGIQFIQEVSDDCMFYGDGTDFLECMGNILDNACKYGNKRIVVRATMQKEKQIIKGLEVVVEDDGPGIDANQVELVTERGVRADTKQEGQGLGLALVKDIVLAYTGEIALSKLEPHGTKARLYFPK